ncbi:MAG: hypothetical protein ACR2F2_09290 [Pyrinomonadaceae bacterium]
MKINFISILTGKNIYYSVSAVLLMFAFVNPVQAQTYEAFVQKRVGQIRVEVNAINKDAGKYKKTTKSVEEISLEGTEATYFHSGKDLKKITAKMYGETYNATAELYYKNGELLFAFVKRNQYDTQIGMDTPPKVTGSEEQRFYFRSDGELIRLLVGKKELKSGDERYTDLKDEIINISGKLKDS